MAEKHQNIKQFPCSIKWAEEQQWYDLPFDPIIAVSGKNNVVKRSALKASNTRGTIKEYWSQDDYQVSIAGVVSSDDEGKMPEEDIRCIRKYCEGKKPLMVKCDFLTLFYINQIVIEQYDFPFTKGIANQMYSIKGVSDNNEKLIENEITPLKPVISIPLTQPTLV